MIVWGGRDDPGGPFNSGARYDPTTDSWVATSTSGAPSARYGHTTVWTGTDMIVWGGTTGLEYLNSGARYNPSADRWEMISNSGAPTTASWFGPAAVWTGREMFFFFARSYGAPFEAARYDPSADTWTTTATRLGFEYHTVLNRVWTGREFIFWGGRNSLTGAILNEGGRYDPSTDTWTPISTSGAPSARYAHIAVWTGREMIVWGGYDGTNGLDGTRLVSGGRYDPSTDSWVATATSGAPPGRFGGVAVWTGLEMIIWGGEGDPFVGPQYGGGSYVPLITGGRYDPSTDSWAATTTSGSPIGRRGPTVVWTGSEMIIWGGETPGASSSGGRYCALSCASPATWYRDDDADGFGKTDDPSPACDQPAGYASAPGDCDDADPAIHPGAADVCNGLDDDCDGVADERPAADVSCDDGNACTLDDCQAGTCVRSPAIMPQAVCTAEQTVLNLGSSGRTFGLTVALGDRCGGRNLDPMRLTPLYVSAVASPSLGRVVLPPPDTGPACTQDGIWESASRRVLLDPATAAVKFQDPSDGLCTTLDGNRQDIIRLLGDAAGGERVEISFAATYPGASASMQCAASVTVQRETGRAGNPSR